MKLTRFDISIIVQAILIAVVPALYFRLPEDEGFETLKFLIPIIWIFQLYRLIYSSKSHERVLTRFLQGFNANDPTISYQNSKKYGTIYQTLYLITESFKKIRIEKEREYQFFKNCIESLGVGILAFDHKGEIKLYNRALLNLFGIHQVQHLVMFDQIQKGFADRLKNLPVEIQEMVKIISGEQIKYLILKASVMKIAGETIKIINFQDIKQQIEQSELDAWQKLIRVLIHEIMNSVSPINIMSAGLLNQLVNKRESDDFMLNNQEFTDMVTGLQTIHKRSRGLTEYINNYRNLTRIPEPEMKYFRIREVFESVKSLFSEEIIKKSIEFNIELPSDNLELFADEKLIEQVLINLIKNSIEATELTKLPIIMLSAKQIESSVVIEIEDNGRGIGPDEKELIFIPFYTNKENGTGIGLSFSRQVLRKHNANIQVSSIPGRNTIFRLEFVK